MFRIKAAFYRFLDVKDICNREAELRFFSSVLHGVALLSLYSFFVSRFGYKNVVYCIIRIKELLLSSFKSLKNVIYLMYIYT